MKLKNKFGILLMMLLYGYHLLYKQYLLIQCQFSDNLKLEN